MAVRGLAKLYLKDNAALMAEVEVKVKALLGITATAAVAAEPEAVEEV
jgi:hypothetical protein